MRHIFPSVLAIVILAITGSAGAYPQNFDEQRFDVVVYGGTSAGVIASVQVARMGKTVVLIEPGMHLGGMSTSGLGRTDTGNQNTIGGLSREFYARIHSEYHGGDPGNNCTFRFEPHVAEEVFRTLIETEGIPVFYGERLDLNHGVEVTNNRIERIIMESGEIFAGEMFIDATYEGDLMALADVSYAIGREGNDLYGETYNGVQVNNARHHNFIFDVDPYRISGDPSSGLLPGISTDDAGEEGSGDFHVQAYNFRMCMTNVPDNRLAWVEPEEYDPERYELLLRYFDAGFNSVPLHIAEGIPGGKSDTNNNSGFSTDYIGMNYEYPDGDYETRERIVRDHENYQRGLMWTLASNPRVPGHIRNTVNEWGLAADEFTDNDKWPYQPYIREARRMVSDYVMTDRNCFGTDIAADPVGMGSYNMDSHNVRRYVNGNGFVRNEGDVQMGISPYAISYRSIIPSADECENLLVPVCVSASHIAYGSIRMEPVYMILGHSAGTAAVIAIDTRTSVQDLFYPILREVLTNQDQVLRMVINPFDLAGIVIDTPSADLSGDWIESISVMPWVGDGYIHDDATGGGCVAVFEAQILRPGNYEVRFYYSAHENRATNVTARIFHAEDMTEVSINERLRPSNVIGYTVLGTFYFDSQEPASIEINNTGADGYVVVDAIQLVRN